MVHPCPFVAPPPSRAPLPTLHVKPAWVAHAKALKAGRMSSDLLLTTRSSKNSSLELFVLAVPAKALKAERIYRAPPLTWSANCGRNGRSAIGLIACAKLQVPSVAPPRWRALRPMLMHKAGYWVEVSMSGQAGKGRSAKWARSPNKIAERFQVLRFLLSVSQEHLAVLRQGDLTS